MILFCSFSQWVISTETFQCFYRMKNGQSELFSIINVIIIINIIIIIIIIIIKNINIFFQLMFTLFLIHLKVNAWPLSFSPNDMLELFCFLLQAFYIPIQQNGSSTGIEKTLSLSITVFYLTHQHTHIIFFVNAQVYQWASLYSLQCLTDPAHRGRVLLRKTR